MAEKFRGIDPLDPTDDPVLPQLPEIPEVPIYDVPPVALSPTSASVVAAGGSDSFTVTITGLGVSGTWICTKDGDANWLTFTPEEPQAEDGIVNYVVGANTTAAPRVAHFYCNGKTFTVNQSG